MRSAALLLAVCVVMASPVFAASTCNCGNLGGLTFDDITFAIVTDGVNLGGYSSFPNNLAAQFSIGHMDQIINTWTGPIVGIPPLRTRIEFFFSPTDIFSTIGSGVFVTRDFTMAAHVNNGMAFTGVGTLTAGWLDGQNFGRQYLFSTFNVVGVPEPSSLWLLVIGLAVGIQLRAYQSRQISRKRMQ